MAWFSILFVGFFLLAGLLMTAGGVWAFRESERLGGCLLVSFGVLLTLLFGAGMVVGLTDEDEVAGSEVDPAVGDDCTLEVLGLEDTGDTRGPSSSRKTVYRFRVRVHVPGKNPYQAESVAPASGYDVARIAAGRNGYRCRVHPDDPRRVEILWQQPTD
ncbi:hypothetical protein ACIBF1_08735 [Spirillospora sp. NPDC050679]